MKSVNLAQALEGRDDITDQLVLILHDEVNRHAKMLTPQQQKILPKDFTGQWLTSMGSACMVRLALSDNINIEALKSLLIKHTDEQKH